MKRKILILLIALIAVSMCAASVSAVDINNAHIEKEKYDA